MNTTEKLLEQYNQIRGLSYSDIGYTYFADIAGDGRNIRKVYVVVNKGGGVAVSGLHASNSKVRCARIRAAIAEHKTEQAALACYSPPNAQNCP
jgi:hypothetical protein